MKSTDCIRVPVGILEYLMGEARFAAENGAEVNTYLTHESATGAFTADERIKARAATMVACDHMAVIVDALQRILSEAES